MVKQEALREVKVEVKTRRHTTGPLELALARNNPKMSTMSANYAYVNSAFMGSTDALNQRRDVPIEPPTTVIREQYCVCSRWPFAQKILAVSVGILFGACIGLGVTMLLSRNRNSLDIGFFRHGVPD